MPSLVTIPAIGWEGGVISPSAAGPMSFGTILIGMGQCSAQGALSTDR